MKIDRETIVGELAAQQHATESNTMLRESIEVAVETNLRALPQHQTSIGANPERQIAALYL